MLSEVCFLVRLFINTDIMMCKIDKGCSVAFTGHRSIPVTEIGRIRTSVRTKVRLLYAMGIRNFISGMALGFDMLAAEEVVFLRERNVCPEIRLVAVVPFRGQSERWNAVERKRYDSLLEKASDVVVLSENYFNSCFFRRNDYMLVHSCGLVAYFDGKPKGGTFYTVRRAREANMEILNLFGEG